MWRKCTVCIQIILAAFVLCSSPVPGNESLDIGGSDWLYHLIAKRDLLVLMIAYPEWITGIEVDGPWIYVLMRTGKKILYDDRKQKTFEEKLVSADLQDMLEQIYSLEFKRTLSAPFQDPGRFRCYEFLNEIYGKNKDEVLRKLIDVRTPFGTFKFNSENSAATQFQSAMSKLWELSRGNKEIESYIIPLGGTYNHRVIEGTELLSMHALGIAVDLNPKKGEYWRHTNVETALKRLAVYPEVIVKIFEDHGFIWGGKWHHFDIMHFEYRPELIIKARYFPVAPTSVTSRWYEPIPLEPYKRYIELIEKAFSNYSSSSPVW